MAEALPQNPTDPTQGGREGEYRTPDTSEIDLKNRQRIKSTLDSYASEIEFLVQAFKTCLKNYKPLPFGVTERVVMPVEKFLAFDEALDRAMEFVSKGAHVFDGLFRFRIGIGGSTPNFPDISQHVINAKYLPSHKQTWLCKNGMNISKLSISKSFKCSECKYGQCYFFMYDVFSNRVRMLTMRLSRLIGSYRMVGMYVLEVPNYRSVRQGYGAGYEEGYTPYDRYGTGYAPPPYYGGYGGLGGYEQAVIPRYLFKGTDAEYSRYLSSLPQHQKQKKRPIVDSGFVVGTPTSEEKSDEEM